jgi:hypothetical protein
VAQILRKTSAQVYRMVGLGRLQRRGEAHKSWGLLLSDVLRCRDRGDPIKLEVAAAMLGGTAEDVRKLIADGELTLVPGSQRLVYEGDVQQLSSTWTRPQRAQPQQPKGPEGHVDTTAAAQILNVSVSRTRQLAASERVPACRDRMGRYWFRPDQLQLVRQAWRAAEEFGCR